MSDLITKKEYEELEIETIEFETEDVLTASVNDSGGGIELPDDEW